MTTSMSVRLSEGIYDAVGELADELGISKSDMATILLYYGLANVKEGTLSERTMALIQAEMLESYGALLRKTAKQKPEEKVRFEKAFGDFLAKLAKVLPWKV